MKLNKLVPELIVTDLNKSYHFWVKILGFSIKYQRIEDKFMYLELDDIQFMLEQQQNNQWQTEKLNYPFGRGINFQLEIKQIDKIFNKIKSEQWPIFSDLEECWYRQDHTEHGQHQFLVQDPDGYLLRIIEVIGDRALNSKV